MLNLKKILGSVLISTLFLIPNAVHAEKQIIKADGEYTFGYGEETAEVAKARARDDAMRNASMKGGSYIHSTLKAVDNMLTEDEIILVTSNFLKLQSEPEYENDTTADKKGFVVVCHVIAVIDTDNVENLLKNKDELEKIISRSMKIEEERDRLREENERLKRELAAARDENARSKILEEKQHSDNRFLANDYFYAAEDFLDDGNYSEALKNINKALEFVTDNEDYYLTRSSTYVFLGEYDRAIDDLNRAFELDPDLFSGYDIRGAVYYLKGDYNRAVADLSKEIGSFGLGSAHLIRGLAYYKLGKINEAVADFEKMEDIHYFYGIPDQIFDDLYTILTNEPAFAGLIESASDMYFDVAGEAWDYGQLNKVVKYITMSINLTTEDDPFELYEMYLPRMQAYLKLGEYDLAIADAEKMVELDPECDLIDEISDLTLPQQVVNRLKNLQQ